jgi:hypothetical protein
VSILQGELAAQIASALVEADIPQPCVITRMTVSGPAWEPILTPVAHACSGLVDSYSLVERGQNSSISASDIKVLVLAPTLDIEPSVADTLTINSRTYAIISVSTDPAQALWEVQARV